MSHATGFEGFFYDPLYFEFKNHLYNYQLRKEKIMARVNRADRRILELGCGISPIMPSSANVIYLDLSFQAIRTLKDLQGEGGYLTASASEIPIRSNEVDVVICSEVLEHLPDDESALQEIWRVMKPGGELFITVPLHQRFFAYDDHFVHHYRRYDPHELVARLEALGFQVIATEKLYGMLDKLATLVITVAYRGVTHLRAKKGRRGPTNQPRQSLFLKILLPFYRAMNEIYKVLVRAEGKVIPLALTTVLLLHLQKKRYRESYFT